MNPAVELPTEAEVIADLKKIRTRDWSNPEAFTGLRALYDLLPQDGRPVRADAVAVRNALLNLLEELVIAIAAKEEQNPPDLGQSIAVAGTHLLKLQAPAGTQTQVDDLVGSIVETWKVRDRHTGEVRPMGVGTFKTNYMDRVVYPALAAHLLSKATTGTEPPASTVTEDESGTAGAKSKRSSRRLRLLAAIGLPVALAACVVTVILVGSRGHGTPTDTLLHKEGCSSHGAARSDGGAGQLEFGDFVRASGSGDHFEDPLTAESGSEAVIKLRLSNAGPGEIDAVCVSATLPANATPSPSVSVLVSSLPAVTPDDPTDTASITTYPARAVCLALVPHSTEFMDRNGAVIKSLPDEILDGGVRVGPIDVPLSSVRFVQFKVALEPSEDQAACDADTDSEPIRVSTLAPSEPGPLLATMQGKNTSFRPRWDSKVSADATDKLAFEVNLKNPTDKTVEAPLLLVVCTYFCTGSGPQPLKLWAALVQRDGKTLTTSNAVDIDAQSGGLQRFIFDQQRGITEIYENHAASNTANTTIPLDHIYFDGGDAKVVKAFQIGDLAPGKSIAYSFQARWDVGSTGQLAGGPLDVRIGSGEWKHTLYVNPGQVVTVGSLLANTHYSRPLMADVRVDFEPDAATGGVSISMDAHLGDWRDQKESQPTGQVKLRSAGAGPIGLELVPGTTRLWGQYRQGRYIKGGDTIKLPDGLADSGIRVGPIGGFIPRDKHHGMQFSRYILFDVKVKRLDDLSH